MISPRSGARLKHRVRASILSPTSFAVRGTARLTWAARIRSRLRQGLALEQLIHPALLYGLLALGGVGVCLALPRRGLNPQPLGALLAASAIGLAVLILSINAREHLPNLYFYVFSAIALGAALRVITHPRPVYSALYFILTILSSCGLYVLLAAEFMAFALVIVYAGAILITYLFVIMLATQAPSEEDLDVMPEYDRAAREPVMATGVGFVLLALLTTLLFRGAGGASIDEALPEPGVPASGDSLLAWLPGKIEESLARGGLLEPGERVVAIDPIGRTATLEIPGAPLSDRVAPWPDDLQATNVEGVAVELLANHPGSIEIAGVVLLMAMLGAVVLARKQVQLDEDAKARHAATLSGSNAGRAT